ncbi:hypothetical protein C8R44DRAFT_800453 [Mycena epipterygia]|nr:hypothetical protein C8R44DRAFT_800453 [Mycena epipterygia]
MPAFILATILGLLIPNALAVPVATSVLTPGGYRPNNTIHEVPVGGRIAHIGSDIHVLDASGVIIHVASPTSGEPAAAVVPRQEETGWVAYAFWLQSDSSDPIASLSTSWTVPPVPTTEHGQTIFLFNSLEPSGGVSAILQPVLQYGPSGAGGGDFWAVASWYVVDGQTFFTSLVPVEVGQPLDGLVSLLGQNGSTYEYSSQFTNIAGTNLAINTTQQFTFATETLEVYAVTESSDFPAGSTVLSGINLVLESGVVPDVVWDTSSSVEDGVSATVNVDGATNAEITIAY